MKDLHFALTMLSIAFALQIFISLYGFGFAEDTYVHAEIARVIANNFSHPDSYQPLAPVRLTYPPLFHYLSLIPYFLTRDLVLAVNIMGYLAVVAFPVAMFLAGSVFGYRTAGFSALFSAVTANFSHIYFFGEFPEVLAMDLFVLFFYFYSKKKYYLSGIFLGFTLLSHAFVGPFAYATAAFLLVTELFKKNFSAFKMLLPATVLSLFWLPRYFQIIINTLLGRWHNAINYAVYPGIVGWNYFAGYVSRLNLVLFLFSLIGVSLVFKHIITKRLSSREGYLGLVFLFLTTFAFTIYHYPPFQLKMLDLLTIPVVLGAAIAANRLLLVLQVKMANKAGFYFAASLLLAAFITFSFVLGPINVVSAYKNNEKYHLPQEFKQAAAFLRGYDQNMSRIIVADEYRYYGKSELIVSQLSGKLPIDAFISDLEYYTPEYQQRLSDRQTVIGTFNTVSDGNYTEDAEALLKKYGVRYVFAKKCVIGEAVFENSLVRVCRV